MKIDQYSPDRARHYEAHHTKALRTRLTTTRERQCLFRALRRAGFPRTVLDLPCGTGRFWPAFVRAGTAELIAADGSRGMLEVARENRLSEQVPAQLLEMSAFQIELPDASVDAAACLRFYHHLAMAEDRRQLLAELKRVSRRHVIVSLWVDGNLAAKRRLRRPPPVPTPGYGRRLCRRRSDVEAEFRAAGLRVVGRYDAWPYLAMWRTYLLEHGDD